MRPHSPQSRNQGRNFFFFKTQHNRGRYGRLEIAYTIGNAYGDARHWKTAKEVGRRTCGGQQNGAEIDAGERIRKGEGTTGTSPYRALPKFAILR